MIEFNVLRLAILISSGYKYFLFKENAEADAENPLIITVKVIPFQKLHDANTVKSLYGESVFLIKTMAECELLFDIAEGFNGIKYVVNDMIEFPKLEIKKALKLVN